MYEALKNRYDTMKYPHCGTSGLKLPMVSFGLWHNFGSNMPVENMKQLRLIMGLRILIWQTITDQKREARRKILGES